MTTARSIVARDDTLLGVCHAIGEDFGFNPLYLRILFAIILFWSPAGAFGLYALLGAVVAFSRWAAPVPVAEEMKASGSSDEEPEEFRLAA